MSDIIDAAFLAPYPTADVYGIGVAASPVPEPAPSTAPAQAESPSSGGARKGGGAPSSEPADVTLEGLGRYVDVKV
jgi:hypothetical protein